LAERLGGIAYQSYRVAKRIEANWNLKREDRSVGEQLNINL